MEKRGSFGSRFGTIAAVGGSVIGLGNIWRFPYVAGENGGAAFMLIYLIISLLISIPIMLSEFAIGRSTHSNPMRAFSRLAPGTPWKGVGYMGILCAFVILSFYCVIAGWALEFLGDSALNRFAGLTPGQIAGNFDTFVASGWRPILWTLVFIGATAFIILSGIEKGIERYNKILMPVLFLLLAGMAANAMTLDGAREGIAFLLRPDFGKITAKTVLEALGQSFFSMSLGMGCMITYGSYLRRNENVLRIGGMVALSDITVAVLSGLAIFPAVFSFGISPTSGPELVFVTLPNVFARMTGGYFLSILFFFLLFLAAITSSVSLMEVIVAYLSEEFPVGRKRAVALTAGTVAVTGSLCALSMIPSSALTVGGMNLFDLCDALSSNVMMPLGGLLIVLFAGWVLSPAKLRRELTGGMRYGTRVYPFVRFLIRFVIPVLILLLFLNRTGVL
ncbi:sodium-dependent transporter [uncultured Alistipes sp.]|uniref:sodium-dependent transporter n=1 Tax=uncultured Alistipes sp. TaxID=538949 RepID=UPI002614BFCB|nr:sodium-dependent transporter [uncultured Alistipes sp.]